MTKDEEIKELNETIDDLEKQVADLEDDLAREEREHSDELNQLSDEIYKFADLDEANGFSSVCRAFLRGATENDHAEMLAFVRDKDNLAETYSRERSRYLKAQRSRANIKIAA